MRAILPSRFRASLLSLCPGCAFSLPYLDLNLIKLHALKALTAGGAVDEPFGVCFTVFLIVEKHPFVRSCDPPELTPDLVLLLARAI